MSSVSTPIPAVPVGDTTTAKPRRLPRGLIPRVAPIAARALVWALCVGGLSESTLALELAATGDSPHVSLSGSHRLRYESMHNGPRVTAAETDEVLVSRLLFSATFQSASVHGQFELQDSRAWLHGPRTPIGTDDVNALEPLQAWVGWRGGDDLGMDIRLGRMTKDLSTRRLVARNRFRNTLNAFEGLDLTVSNESLWVNAFAFRPVHREPFAPRAVRDNDIKLDRTSSEQLFTGVELAPRGKL